MAGFYFRLRFHLPQDDSIDFPGAALEIPVGPDVPSLRLRANDGDGSIKSARRLVLTGGPFASLEEASDAGARARHAVMRYSIQSRVAIDLGKNRATGGLSRYARDRIAEHFQIQILNDVHGLLIYEGTSHTRFASVGGRLTLGHPFPAFLDLFKQAYRQAFQPTEKEEVAFELFAAAQFEPSPHSRFLTLVMAIEALLEPADRAEQVQEHVDSLIHQTANSELPEDEIKSLTTSLRWLCQDSISKTGRKLATGLLGQRTYAGKNAPAFFSHCYHLRSQLVHTGKINEENVKLGTLVPELERFVADLLAASIQSVNLGTPH